MPTYGKIMTDILDEYGARYGKDIVKIITPLGFVGTADYFIGMGVREERERLVEMMIERAIDAYTHRIEAKAGVIATLTELKAQGYSLNVLTASPHETLDPCLKRLGIYSIFDNVWSCNDFNTSKSDPAIYTAAAKRLGVLTSEVVFLDDNYGADCTAKAAGMRVIGVFDESSRDVSDRIKAVADGYIYSLSELLS
jgi:HAD superfamily hydrolase (TIGR01509 family)